MWANLLISLVLQGFGISIFFILNLNPLGLSVIISFWFWFLGRLEITLTRLAECWVHIIPAWQQSFLSIFMVAWLWQKTEVAPIEYQWCNILRSEKNRSRLKPLLGSRGHGDCQIRWDNRWLKRFRMALNGSIGFGQHGTELLVWFGRIRSRNSYDQKWFWAVNAIPAINH